MITLTVEMIGIGMELYTGYTQMALLSLYHYYRRVGSDTQVSAMNHADGVGEAALKS